MKEYDYYIFDFDGTLFDSVKSMGPVFRAGLEAVGKTCTDEEAEHFMHGSLKDVMAAKGIRQEEFKAFLDAIIYSIELPENIALVDSFEDTLPTLLSLKEKGKVLGVASSNGSIHIKNVLNQKNFPELFSCFVGFEHVKRGKPDPEPIEVALKMLGAEDKSRVLYIGDSIVDYQAARAAGIDYAIVDRDESQKEIPDGKIKSLIELL